MLNAVQVGRSRKNAACVQRTVWSTGPGCGWGPGPGGRGHDGLEDAVGQRRDWNPTKTKLRSLVSPQDLRRSNRQGVTSFTHLQPPCVCVLWPGGARRWEALVKGAALPSRRLPCGRGKCTKAPPTPSSRHRQMLCWESAERQALGGRAASPHWDASSASSLRAFGEGGSAAGWGHWAQKALTAPAGGEVRGAP